MPTKPMSKPEPNEIWVMRVQITKEDSDEIRYLPLNIDNRTYGAVRVISKADFYDRFSLVKDMWEFQVRINHVETEEDSVSYMVLKDGAEIESEKRLSMIIFLSCFYKKD